MDALPNSSSDGLGPSCIYCWIMFEGNLNPTQFNARKEHVMIQESTFFVDRICECRYKTARFSERYFRGAYSLLETWLMRGYLPEILEEGEHRTRAEDAGLRGKATWESKILS